MFKIKSLLLVFYLGVMSCSSQPQRSMESYRFASSCEGKIMKAASVKTYDHAEISNLLSDSNKQTELIDHWVSLSEYFEVCPHLNVIISPNDDSINFFPEQRGWIEMLPQLEKTLSQLLDNRKSDFIKDNKDLRVGEIVILINGVQWVKNKDSDFVDLPWYFNYPQDAYQLYCNGIDCIQYVNFRPGTYGGGKPQVNQNKCLTSKGDADLGLSGGNIHVLHDIAFIGHNVLRAGYDIGEVLNQKHRSLTKQRLEKIQCDSSTSLDTVQSRIKQVLGVNHIVWVGSEEKLDLGRSDGEARLYSGVSSSNGWQPFYHIDLFFLPLHFDQSDKTLYYFIADAESRWQKTHDLYDDDYKELLKKLNASLDSTEEYIQRQLKSKNIHGVPIKIPMNVVRKNPSEFGNIAAFLNGHMDSEYYFMPNFATSLRDSGYKKAKDSTVSKFNEYLPRFGRKLVIVTDTYGSNSALHCELFVYDRK